MTPVAASMKLHRLVGADSYVGSLVWRVKGRVAMRKAVVKQIKKPMEKSTTRPIFEPRDMFRRRITGMGKMNMAISVTRLRIALDHLDCVSKSMHSCVLPQEVAVLTDARKS
jgi:hypothetical protein